MRRTGHDAGRLLLLAVVAQALAVFVLQARYLHLAAHPATDEIEIVEGARRWAGGDVPYRDFYVHRPPLIYGLVALGWNAFGSLYPIRLLHLAINCLSPILLYLTLRRFRGPPVAAFVATSAYLGFHVLTHVDFRFIAWRQLANVVLLAFMLVAVRVRAPAWRAITLALLGAIAMTLSFQAPPNLLLFGAAAILAAPTSDRRRILLRELLLVGVGMLAALALTSLLFPAFFDMVFSASVAEFPRPRVGRRMLRAWQEMGPDRVFYVTGLAGLLGSLPFARGFRPYAVGMLLMVFHLFLVPKSFLPFHLVLAGPAFAFGIFFLLTIVSERSPTALPRLAGSVAAILLLSHLSLTMPPLLQEWHGNRGERFWPVVEYLRTAPEPVLSFTHGIAVVEAGKEPVRFFEHPSLRDFMWNGHRLNAKKLHALDLRRLAERACTILVTPWERWMIPQPVFEDWLARYERVWVGRTSLFLTHRASCGSPPEWSGDARPRAP